MENSSTQNEAPTDQLSPATADCHADEASGQNWSLEPSPQQQAGTVAASSGADGNGDQHVTNQNTDMSFGICGPLKVRLKRHRQTTANNAAHAEQMIPTADTSHPDRKEPSEPNAELVNLNEPEKFPVARGSQVNLRGTVWLESANDGLLILRDVIWRGRRFAGALVPEEMALPVPKSGQPTSAARRRGGRRRRHRRQSLQGHQQLGKVVQSRFTAYDQLQGLNLTASKESLISELSSDGSIVYRVPPKPSEPEVGADCKTTESDSTLDAVKVPDQEEQCNSEAEAAVTGKDAGAIQTAAAYSDISEDEGTSVPYSAQQEAYPIGGSYGPAAVDFDPSLIAAYARFLFDRHQQSL